MFISSLWDVKEPTHYSTRVGDEVPGVVAVLVSVWVGGYSTSTSGPSCSKVDSAIHWIDHYPLDNSIAFASVYPLDSAIHPSNNWGQLNSCQYFNLLEQIRYKQTMNEKFQYRTVLKISSLLVNERR